MHGLSVSIATREKCNKHLSEVNLSVLHYLLYIYGSFPSEGVLMPCDPLLLWSPPGEAIYFRGASGKPNRYPATTNYSLPRKLANLINGDLELSVGTKLNNVPSSPLGAALP